MSESPIMCFQVFPPLLFLAGVLALIGWLPVGPLELPRRHADNRRLGACVLLVGIGLFLVPAASTPLSSTGILLCVMGLMLYILIQRRVRSMFPPEPHRDRLRRTLSRYTFMAPNEEGKEEKDTSRRRD